MKKLMSFLTVAVFFGFLLFFLISGFFQPDAPYSKTENRVLTQYPVMDLTDLPALTGRFTDYVVDQFPYREKMLQYYSALELMQGKRYSRDTYVTEDGWLLTRIYAVQEDDRQAIVNAVAHAAQNCNAAFVYAVLPQKNDMLAELAAPYLDNTVSDRNKAALLEELMGVDSLTVIDVGAQFLQAYTPEERMAMYYRTDFHWNDRGAFRAAEYIARQLSTSGLLDGALVPAETDFLWQELGDAHLYQGDLNRRFSNLFSMREAIPYYCLNDTAELQYYLSADDAKPAAREEIISTGLAEDTLTYNTISTNNLGFYRAVNPNARTSRHILILKDSFQNPTTDYFTELFTEVIVIDPRYYNEPYSFTELVTLHEVDLVLLMYHQNNASTELVDFLSK